MVTMKHEDIPQDVVDDAVDGWHNAPQKDGKPHALLDDVMRHVLAAALPRHAALVRAEIAKEIEEYGRDLMDQAVDRVMSDDPGGHTAAMRAATVNHVAKYILRDG